MNTEEPKDVAMPSPASAGSALALAIRFHQAYERLAPRFGYETRPETRAFDPQSQNGRLMVAVCREIIEQNEIARLRLTDDELEVLAWLSSAGDEGRDTIQRITPGMRSVIRALLNRHANGGGA